MPQLSTSTDKILTPDVPYTKANLINTLGEIRGAHRYLEFCTSQTGYRYAEIDRKQFSICHRMMYRCPDSYNDNMPVDFRSNSLDVSSCLKQIKAKGQLYDLILVDPWHEYETSYRDISIAFELLDVGGSLVVHDCLPPNAHSAASAPHDGEWCGVTYKAFLDFICRRGTEFTYYTVDMDYGCGIISPLTRKAVWLNKIKRFYQKINYRKASWDNNSLYNILFELWIEKSIDSKTTSDTELFHFFSKNSKVLLRLKPYTEFLQIESIRSKRTRLCKTSV